jgi:flagellar hook-length control protein FliK
MDDASNILKKGSGRIVITLEPPNLGTLNMDVRVQHDTVRMLLIADNHEVKQVLHSNLDQLKTALQGQGLNVDRFDVLVQERNFDGNPGFHPGGGALFEEGRGRRDNTKEDNHPSQMVPSGGNELNEPSLGSISLFV